MRTFMLLMFSLLVAGCSIFKEDHLIMSTYTRIGLHVTSTDGKPTGAQFGYKRFEGAIIPVNPEDTEVVDGKQQEKDVMSTFSTAQVDNSWIKGLTVRQLFGTGQAAINLANNPELVEKLVKKKEEEKK